MMDKNDKKILALLKENSRYSNQDVANLVGIQEGEVVKKIQQLMDKGIICQFTTVINDNDINDVPIKALVELSISPQKGSGYDSIAKKICGFQNVTSHYLVSGKYDFLVVVEGDNHKDIAHFVFDKLATLDNVTSTTTHFIFKSYKEQGVLLDNQTLIPRVAVQP